MKRRSLTEWLAAAGEVIAAGMFEEINQTWPRRTARGLRRCLDAAPLAPVAPGDAFYPGGKFNFWACAPDLAVAFSFSHTLWTNYDLLNRKLEATKAGFDNAPAWHITDDLQSLTSSPICGRFSCGGNEYTHSILDFATLLDSGLNGTRRRLENGRLQVKSEKQRDWYLAEEEVLDAIERLVRRCADHLRASGAPERLCTVFEREIWSGASDFYSALALFNFFWYLDGCDSIGRFDSYVRRYFELEPVERADAERWLLELWRNTDLCDGWHMLLGGHSGPGESAYSALTEIVLSTLGVYRRPNAGLLYSEDMPEAYWDIIFDNFAKGGVNPALYNEPGYFAKLKKLTRVPDAELYKMSCGGCTELMFSGSSSVGSIDAGINVLETLCETLREAPPAAGGFDAFLARFETDVLRELELIFGQLELSMRKRELVRPQPVRSLFIADCLERGLDYNAGGARCNGSVINFAGLSNCFNSLWVLKQVCDGALPFDMPQLLAMLQADFEGYEAELKLIEALPKFGNGIAELDAMAAALAKKFFDAVTAHHIYRGDGFAVPAVIMFVTYDMLGEKIGATPDGRRSRAPIGDSVGAVQGTDRNGPTALLNSCTALPQADAVGTLVLNLRVDAELIKSPEGRERLKALLKTYFAGGGLQVQLTMADTAMLTAALAEPDQYPHLMVRIGGYSEYFRNLSDALKREVIKRNILS